MAHILVADDDSAIVDLITTILSKAGHQISRSASGLETLRKLGLEPEDASVELPDLILLDIMMPKSDGYTVGTVIRNRERTRHIPIIIVSALREMSRLFEATVKVDGFLSKPFSPDDLLGTVNKILAQSKAQAKA
ncbi:MAG: response regulator [Elusimicrobia bacterium]|nr:response regulator [Elusimicrobiota bacterium]